jgi:hypothetical protein
MVEPEAERDAAPAPALNLTFKIFNRIRSQSRINMMRLRNTGLLSRNHIIFVAGAGAASKCIKMYIAF